MTKRIFQDHLSRIKAAVLEEFTASTVSVYVQTHTKIGISLYSFKDHEFQEALLNDDAKQTNLQKCTQIGATEVAIRRALSLANILQPYTVIYTLPTAKFANTFMKTRVSPVVNTSGDMRSRLSKENDNMEVKQFGDSFLYLKGAAAGNAPISIPADHLIHDEIDYCDQVIIGEYNSRLKHSKYKKIDRFSTPTLPGFGINRHFLESRRHYLMAKCDHCNHQFIPDYYDHVKIPGYLGELRGITKFTLTKIRWEEAALHCPACGKVPSLQWPTREWVCENPGDKYVGTGRQISPFDAPNIVTAAELVFSSTGYEKIQGFVNADLGLPMEDADATLVEADFATVFSNFQLDSGVVYVMGVDVGALYHFAVAGVDSAGTIFIVHREQVPMGMAKQRYHELRLKYRVLCTVMDSAPHGETVMSLQEQDVNMFAAVYMKSKSMVTHTVVNKGDDVDEGKQFIRQVNINRSRAFDVYMLALREGKIAMQDGEDKPLIIQHHMSMKRVKVYDTDSMELNYSWQKTDGQDHYHHTFLYCWIAAKIRGVHQTTIALPTCSIFSFRLRNDD